MHKKLIEFNQSLRKKSTLPDLHSGDVIKVYRKIKEGGKERTQLFQGTVIALKGGQSSSPTITVRKISFGVGVELVLPLLSPAIEKIEIVKSTKSRRAKLYYVRKKSVRVLSKKLKEVALKAKDVVVVEEGTPEGETLPAEMETPKEEIPAEEKKGSE